VAVDSTITIVSGLPRSGTSLMMQMLQAGGLPSLTDSVRSPDENNPRGYLEFEPVKRLRVDQSWLTQAQGHAVKIIHLFLRDLPVDGRFVYRVVLMKRPMEEILTSQRLMLERQGKTAVENATLAQIYQSQLSQVEQWLGSQPHFSCLPVWYHDVLRNPLEIAHRINSFLGDHLDVAAMASAVDPSLWHQRCAVKID
jgi:hypothetical protein